MRISYFPRKIYLVIKKKVKINGLDLRSGVTVYVQECAGENR